MRALVCLAMGAFAVFVQAAPRARTPAIAIARIAYAEDVVERQPAGDRWTRVADGAELRIGDRLRTGPLACARVDYPWMSLVLSPDSELGIPDSLVLSSVLERGRVEQVAPNGEIVKLLTAEASVRGGGHVVVRRENGRTLISVLAGRFKVDAAGRQVTLLADQGTVVSAKAAPLPPMSLPPPPGALDPGDDPRYAAPNEPVLLQFLATQGAHHVQLLALDTPSVLIERDVALGSLELRIPWQGTFRWRASARDANGLEGRPSPAGLIAVVAK